MEKTNNHKLLIKMKIIAVLLTINFLLTFVPNGTHAQEIFNLEKCISIALQNNLQRNKLDLDILNSENILKQSKINITPTIGANATHEYNWGQRIDPFTNTFATQRVQSNNFYLSGRLILFAGMQNYYTIIESKQTLEILELEKKINARNIKIDVISGYLKTLLISETVVINTELEKIRLQELEKTQNLVNSGRLSEMALLEIKSTLENDRLVRIKSENEKHMTHYDFYTLLNLDQEKIVLDSVLPIFPSIVFNTNMTDKLEEQKSKIELERAKTRIELEKRKYYPTLSLNGSIGTGYSGNSKFLNDNLELETKRFNVQLDENFYQNLSLNLVVPILTGGKNRLTVLEKYSNFEIAQLNSKIQLIDFQRRVERLLTDISNNQYELVILENVLSNDEKEVNHSEALFESGRISYFEFKNKVNQLYLTKSKIIQTKYELLFKQLLLSTYFEE